MFTLAEDLLVMFIYYFVPRLYTCAFVAFHHIRSFFFWWRWTYVRKYKSYSRSIRSTYHFHKDRIYFHPYYFRSGSEFITFNLFMNLKEWIFQIAQIQLRSGDFILYLPIKSWLNSVRLLLSTATFMSKFCFSNTMWAVFS